MQMFIAVSEVKCPTPTPTFPKFPPPTLIFPKFPTSYHNVNEVWLSTIL